MFLIYKWFSSGVLFLLLTYKIGDTESESRF